MDGQNEFNYTYTPINEKELKEVEAIRNRYVQDAPRCEKLKRLKALDDRVRGIPTAISLVFGIVGTLIFGTGMSLVLEFQMYILGIIIAAVSIIPIALAYPMFNHFSRKLREKHSEEIIRLSDELLDE